MDEIVTPGEVIEVLGGDHKVAEKLCRTVQAVRNWRYGRGIPPALQPFVDAQLSKRGKRSASTVYSSRKAYSLELPRRKMQGLRRRGTK